MQTATIRFTQHGQLGVQARRGDWRWRWEVFSSAAAQWGWTHASVCLVSCMVRTSSICACDYTWKARQGQQGMRVSPIVLCLN